MFFHLPDFKKLWNHTLEPSVWSSRSTALGEDNQENSSGKTIQQMKKSRIAGGDKKWTTPMLVLFAFL